MASAIADWVRESPFERFRYHHKLNGRQEGPASSLSEMIRSEVTAGTARIRAVAEANGVVKPYLPGQLAQVGTFSFIRDALMYGRRGRLSLKWSDFAGLPVEAQVAFLAHISGAVLKCQMRWDAGAARRAEREERMDAEVPWMPWLTAK